MRKLLSANYSRLWRDKIFWICMGTMLVYSVVYMLNGCRQATVDLTEYNYSIDKYYFHFAMSIGVFCAVFSSMFFGTEYSDGTIRNKVIVGHTKVNIYIASLITTITATLLMVFVWMIGASVAIPILGIWKMGIPNLLVYLLIIIMLAVAFAAICTLINMLSTNKAFTVVISVLLIMGLLIFASMFYNGLCEPEMTSGVQITASGMQISEPTPNPNYVSGAIRKVYEFILDFLPTGQGLTVWQVEVGHPIRMILSSAAITFLTTLSGIFVFKKKNLK